MYHPTDAPAPAAIPCPPSLGPVVPNETDGALPLDAFTCGEQRVPYTMDGETIWLLATPLCRALGLKVSAKRRAAPYLARIDQAEKGYKTVFLHKTPQRVAVITPRGALALATGRRGPVDVALLAGLQVLAMLND